MTYTTPPTVTSADQMTAALWNTYITDNLETIAKPPAWNLRLSAPYISLSYTADYTVTWDDSTLLRGCTWTSPSDTVTIDSDGWYRVGWTWNMDSTPLTQVWTKLKINGTLKYETSQLMNTGGYSEISEYDHSASFVYWLEATDTVQLEYRIFGSGTTALLSPATRFYGFQIAES